MVSMSLKTGIVGLPNVGKVKPHEDLSIVSKHDNDGRLFPVRILILKDAAL